jgi:hypothetical protein
MCVTHKNEADNKCRLCSSTVTGFSTAIAELVLQYPAGGVQFQRIGADKGDSGLKRIPMPEWLLPRDNAQVYAADCEVY